MLAFWLTAKFSLPSPQKKKRFYWLVTNTPQSPSLKENSFCKTEKENLLIYSLTIKEN